MLIFCMLSLHIERVILLFTKNFGSSKVIQPRSHINHYLLIFWNHYVDSFLYYLLLAFSLFLVEGLKNHLSIHLIVPSVLIASRVSSNHCRVEFSFLLKFRVQAAPVIRYFNRLIQRIELFWDTSFITSPIRKSWFEKQSRLFLSETLEFNN